MKSETKSEQTEIGFELRLISAFYFALAALVPILFFYAIFGWSDALIISWVPFTLAGLFGFNVGAKILDPRACVSGIVASWSGVKTAGLAFVSNMVIFSIIGSVSGSDNPIGLFVISLVFGSLYVGWLVLITGAIAGILLFLLRSRRSRFWLTENSRVTKSRSLLLSIVSFAVFVVICIVPLTIQSILAIGKAKKERELASVSSGDPQALMRLLADGADPDFKELPGNPLITQAAREGKAEVVKIMLDYGADPNRFAPYSLTALAFAAQNSDLNMLQLLVKAGADVNLPSGEDEMTPLMYAGPQNSIETVKLLLDNGALVNARNRHGMTVLTLVKKQREYVDAVNEDGTVMFPKELLACDKMIVFLQLHGAIE